MTSDPANTPGASGREPEFKLEAIVVPVGDVDRAADFYSGLGWRVDADIRTPDGGRILQFTPPGSPASILIGTHLTPSPPGSAQFVHLVVSDIVRARADLAKKGVSVSEVFHDAAGGYDRFTPGSRAAGPDPLRRSYASFATFTDPDGNGWVLQEITSRFEGRIDPEVTSFASIDDLASALRRAAAAHGEHENDLGAPDPNWPDWYARHIAEEQAHGTLPA